MRNLVLLLTSGHTVRIALRDDDLADPTTGIEGASAFIGSLSATMVNPFELNVIRNEFGRVVETQSVKGDVVFAYVENPVGPTFKPGSMEFEPPDDYQRITVEGPGAVVRYD